MKLYIFLWESAAADRDDRGWKPLPQGDGMTKPRLLIADDHKIFAEGLKRLLNADFDIVGVVADGRELVSAAEKLRPDVMVVDISMPMLNGIEAVRQIKKVHPEIKVVFLTITG